MRGHLKDGVINHVLVSQMGNELSLFPSLLQPGRAGPSARGSPWTTKPGSPGEASWESRVYPRASLEQQWSPQAQTCWPLLLLCISEECTLGFCNKDATTAKVRGCSHSLSKTWAKGCRCLRVCSKVSSVEKWKLRCGLFQICLLFKFYLKVVQFLFSLAK